MAADQGPLARSALPRDRQALAAWREREAQRRDLPRNRILRDDLLLELAANRPRSVEDIAQAEADLPG